jgi:mono/diheme cytochrome c family protein
MNLAPQILWLPAFAVTALSHISICHAQTAASRRVPPKTGEDLYRSACVSCHGPDGRGAPIGAVGFDTPLPDFSNCELVSPEPDRDWVSVIRLGGRARALDPKMPAFGEALSGEEIQRIVGYVRGFCTGRRWPRGDLNLPRPLVTEKPFPENEAFVRTTVPATYTDRVDTQFVYEHRVGPRSEYEVVVPLNVVKGVGEWNRGLGDVSLAFKHVVLDSLDHGSIVSAGGEMTFPTGNEREFLGNRLTIFEPFGTFSQILPRGGFLHGQAGFEIPLNIPTASNAVYWRAAVGKTLTQGRWGRAWSPMVEVLGIRELAFDEPAVWDLLPEMQVTLSRRQHIMVSGGVRFPLNQRSRSPTVIMSLLWDWYHGGLFSGW